MRHQSILLPGAVLPAELAYPGLIEALGDDVTARARNLAVYATDEPPADYGLEVEVDAVLAEADAAGFERFHLVGYSAGGAISAAVVAREPDRVSSLALLEPAWLGNEGRSVGEAGVWSEIERLRDLPAEEMMPRFVRAQLAPEVEPPPPLSPPPPWMAKRPAGIRAFTLAAERHHLDLRELRRFDRPVHYALGGLSNPRYFAEMAERMRSVFADYTVQVFPDRHHFDPPHRAEPGRLAAGLRELWDRAIPAPGGRPTEAR